jgi:hypothetical protein
MRSDRLFNGLRSNRVCSSFRERHRDAPEIDGTVKVDESIPVGSFAEVTIQDWRGYDLVAAR